ncbi:MAG: hypothetical protein HC836_42460 [Richelia sp. RM2_1_2]|nr:hypothetical protein [Richelia sp. SM2_1_7]NJM21756.1 hypothetical protein [Richelia sp. SM1_7_0]NJN12348.1 hypothetical protein [Richelia sp. RM1_1_1]NJO30688.1 hypothetical protein [Richelia sp. SL_2_1]NJO64572.1 hypothetical protein [Richelia sp. RM2_1_2]
MTELATQVPTSTVISMLSAINEENYSEFKKLELEFVENYGIETWEDVFNFRVMPALSKTSKQWLLIQKCSKGYTVKEMV